ncbi:MAG: hypothetical protein EXS47_02195 [Candidatus Zambryskibacteria bacterium]|nr:hypothetical protein [Candidatus Zambryskibacteria bacterium]
MSSPLFRTMAFVIVLVLTIVLPWWLSIFILAGLTLYTQFYIEVLFFGFLLDALYSSTFSFPYIGLSISALFLLAAVLIKTQIRK